MSRGGEYELLSEAIDALDRLYDGDAAATEVRAILRVVGIAISDRELGVRISSAAEELAASIAEADLRFAVVSELVSIVRPFGRLSAEVIDPGRFDDLASLIVGALARRSADGIASALAELEATPALADDEEPDGVGFYALGAVVELIYAGRLVRGDAEPAVHALARASGFEVPAWRGRRRRGRRRPACPA